MKRVTQHPYAVLLVYIALATWMFGHIPQSVTVDIGGDRQSGLREYDTPYLTGFWPSEPQPWTPSQGPALRWSHADWHIAWPHAGFGWWIASLHIDASGRNSSPSVPIHWHSPNIGTHQFQTTARVYHVLVQSSKSDSPTVASTVDTFQPANDSRQLGIAVTQIRLTPLQRMLPGLGFVWLVVCLWWSWLLLTRMPIVSVFSALLSIGTYYFFQEWVHIHTTIGLPLTLSGMLLSGILWWRNRTRWHVAQIIIMTSLMQMIMLMSPWLRSSDIAMHVRMLKQVISGSLLFTAQLPCEAGAYISPYPPMAYVLLAPFAMIMPHPDAIRYLLLTSAIVVNGVAVLYMGRVLFAAQRMPLQHAWFVVLASMNFPLLRAAHTGEISNAVAHGLVTIAIISWFDPRTSTGLRILLASIALLAHTGNSISFVIMLGILVLLNIYEKRELSLHRMFPYVVIPICLTLLYYSNYTALIGQAPGYAGCPPVIPLGQRMASLANVIPPAFLLIALLGIGMLNTHLHRTVVRVGVGAALLSASMLLINTQTVRWGISVVPFLALPTAMVLTHMWRIGRAGKLLAVTSTAAWLCVMYIPAWVRVMTYLHD